MKQQKGSKRASNVLKRQQKTAARQKLGNIRRAQQQKQAQEKEEKSS